MQKSMPKEGEVEGGDEDTAVAAEGWKQSKEITGKDALDDEAKPRAWFLFSALSRA